MKQIRQSTSTGLHLAFKERFPWIGSDLQTLRNSFVSAVQDAPLERRLFLPLRDGDTLTARLDKPVNPSHTPLIILIHGLTGSENSTNIVSAALFFIQLGWRVLRLNLRGSTPTRPGTSGHYHAGKTDDLVDALRNLPDDLTSNGIILIGHSLGANLILKFLGEEQDHLSVLCGVAISSPLNLRATCMQMMKRRNALYQRYILSAMKQEALAKGARLTDTQRNAIIKARTLYDFDNDFIAPLFGYDDALHYYESNSSENFLAGIKKPTLIIHALDDPWIPSQSYLEQDWTRYSFVETAINDKGGHLGFHGKGSPIGWHNRVTAHWLENL